MSGLILGEKEYCYKLGSFLTDELNQAYERLRLRRPTELPKSIVVKTFRNFDDVNVPLSEFPLLKVYRSSEMFRPGTSFRDVTGTITYSVSYPDLRTLPDLLYWVSYKLHYLMEKYDLTVNEGLPQRDIQQNHNTQYLLTANELSQPIYPFLRFSFQFPDYYSQELQS
jgi:hypothetical protein